MAAGDLAPPADDLLPAQPLELALATEPPSPGPGEPAKLQVTVRDLNGNPVPWDELLVVHGQKIHVIIVPDDFEALTHAHAFPAVGGAVGTFELSTVFPRAGRYAISVECAVRGAAPGGEPEMLRVFRPFVLGVGGAGERGVTVKSEKRGCRFSSRTDNVHTSQRAASRSQSQRWIAARTRKTSRPHLRSAHWLPTHREWRRYET